MPHPALDPSITTLLNEGLWFSRIPAPLQEALIHHGREFHLQRGETLFRRGDPACGLYAMIEGALRISMVNEEGKEAILTFIDPPNWIGEVSLVDGQPRTHDAIAETPCRLLHVPQPALESLLQQAPAYWRCFGQLLSQKLRFTFYAIEDYALLPAPQRLIRRLVMMAEGYGNRTTDTPQTIHLQQEQLGRMLSISRQTTNQILKDLEASGLLRLVYGGIEILDLAGLQKRGNLPPMSGR
ncbi:MAG: Crp/Fnr family transcriptional regulator [Pseudomonadota bacterium]|nr:Crp/Fnr family transcriptional regulator [Pseudomonadota bacterium]